MSAPPREPLTSKARADSSALVMSPRLVAAAQGYASAATAASTRRAYASSWATFQRWCDEKDLVALPAEPASVALFLADLAENSRKVATIRRHLAAIAKAHRTSGFLSPRLNEAVRSVMRGISRTLGSAQTQKAALATDELRDVIARLPVSLRGVRDRALLTLGFAGAFRRSELVGLVVSDLTFTSDGMEVTVRRSKTDQEGQGHKKAIPLGSRVETCPVRSVKAWLAASGITEGPVLRSVSRAGRVGRKRLDGGSVARIIKKVVASTGRSAADYSGHSLRTGLITSAVRAGKTEASIMKHTGHRSVAMLRRYVRNTDLFTDNCVEGIGL